jgi:hypothetical protein
MTGPTVPWSKTRCLTLRPQLENAPAAALLAGLGVVFAPPIRHFSILRGELAGPL